jgi:hypothetical protein
LGKRGKRVKNLFLIFLLVAGCGNLLAQDFQTDLGWLNQALRNARGQVRSTRSFMKYDSGKMEYYFSDEKAPWGANYFPMDENGLANRWQISTSEQLGLKKDTTKNLLSNEEAKSLEFEMISLLSPAEKLDLYLGNDDFKITKRELRKRGPLRRPKPEDWEGFCNGVRIAGVHEPEPIRPIVVENARGQQIEFQPSDIKALLGAAYFYVRVYNQIGSPTRGDDENENLPNAGVFDIALRTFLGENEKGFIIDVNKTKEIWNETVMGYTRNVSSERETTEEEKAEFNNAAKKVTVHLRYRALGEFTIMEANGFTGDITVRESNRFRATYTLFLDARGNIVDGEWVSGRFPDFAWFAIGAADEDYTRGRHSGNPHIPYRALVPLVREASK